MRIVSDAGKKDYYDCIQAHDEDRQTLYIRNEKTEQHPKESWPFPVFDTWGDYIQNVSLRLYVIGFCGQIYPMLELDHYRCGEPSYVRFCRNMEDVDAFMLSCLDEKALSQFNASKGHMKFRDIHNNRLVAPGRRRYSFEKLFSLFEENKTKYESMFTRLQPIFVASRNFNHDTYEVTFNAQLKPLEFFRVMSPGVAYQELSRFLCNQATPEKPIPQMDDVTMAESKGFHKKFSFRKDPIRKRK